MATENLVRMVESGVGRKLPTFKDATVFGSSMKSMEEEEFELLLKGCRIHGDQTDLIPGRSGSAPPSMEGSFAAIGNILAQQNFSISSSLESLSEVIEKFESEEQLRSDPAYLAYYCSNVNLNPRLPPPLMSRENRHLVCHVGGLGNNWRSSLNDGGKPLQFSKGLLPTHKEESEDGGSPKEAAELSSSLTAGQSTSLAGRHKSLVDLIQEDFPRTPSPVYSQSRSSSLVAEEAINHDVHAIPSNISSLKISEVAELDPGFSNVSVETHALEAQAGRRPSPLEDGSSNGDVNLDGSTSLGGSNHSDIVRMESQHHLSSQQRIPHQASGVQVQSISQGMKQTHSGVDNCSHIHVKLSPIDVQPSLHPPALNPPLYASTAAYMTSGSPLYHNFQLSGLYSPQYSVGGYAFGSGFISPFVAGYTSHSSINVPFGASSSSAGENIANSGGFQHLSKIYGQQGLLLQPSFADPSHMNYFHHLFVDAFGATAPHNLVALNAATSGLIDPFVAMKNPSTNSNDQKSRPTTNGNLSIPGAGGVGIASNSYYIGSSSMGVMPQFPASPLPSPVLPSSPVGGINLLGQQNSMVFSQNSSRNAVPFSGGQGQRGLRSFDDPKRHYFLEELKSSNAQKVELSDIAGHIVEFCADQHGSRFIQEKLEHCSIEEKVSVFKEILPHSSKLMTDVFGNYVIQKFFEHGSPEQRKELADKLAGQMLHLSLQMCGCRVIQKALEVIELEQRARLVQELDGHIIRCVHDQNGNHVIQKCIPCIPADNSQFIISAFRGQVATLSTHPYGCRVIQRVLEHCLDEAHSQFVVDEILESADLLAYDQYGNYVTQHILERGKAQERSQIISKLMGKIVQMSQHKYASNVVEKCLEYGDAADRELLIQEIIGQSEGNDNLVTMMKDQFANYVVQKILNTSNDDQKKMLFNCIRSHLQALRKYTYGKHIVARFEQLCGKETQTSES